MKGLLARLFGGSTAAAPPAPDPAQEYQGFRIRAAPFASERQWQTAGVIEKDFPGGTREHRFIRAERHASREEASALAILKGKQIIDERGDRIFDR